MFMLIEIKIFVYIYLYIMNEVHNDVINNPSYVKNTSDNVASSKYIT